MKFLMCDLAHLDQLYQAIEQRFEEKYHTSIDHHMYEILLNDLEICTQEQYEII